MNRRDFITVLGGAAVAWPLAARAQQQPKMRRLGFVGIQPREAPVYTNFLRRMAELGYQESRNFTFDYIQTPDVEGYERNDRELAARIAGATCRAVGCGRQADRVAGHRFRPCGEGVIPQCCGLLSRNLV